VALAYKNLYSVKYQPFTLWTDVEELVSLTKSTVTLVVAVSTRQSKKATSIYIAA